MDPKFDINESKISKGVQSSLSGLIQPNIAHPVFNTSYTHQLLLCVFLCVGRKLPQKQHIGQ